MSRAAADAANAILAKVRSAAEIRWLTIGSIASGGAVDPNQLSLVIDGQTVTKVRRLASYASPVAYDVVLVGVVRGTSSVQYLAIGKIA